MSSEELTQELNKRNITLKTIEEYIKFEDECVEKGFTFKSLLEAREKQTAKKIEEHNKTCKCRVFDYMDYECTQRVPYCCVCGQRIDWSEVE